MEDLFMSVVEYPRYHNPSLIVGTTPPQTTTLTIQCMAKGVHIQCPLFHTDIFVRNCPSPSLHILDINWKRIHRVQIPIPSNNLYFDIQDEETAHEIYTFLITHCMKRPDALAISSIRVGDTQVQIWPEGLEIQWTTFPHQTEPSAYMRQMYIVYSKKYFECMTIKRLSSIPGYIQFDPGVTPVFGRNPAPAQAYGLRIMDSIVFVPTRSDENRLYDWLIHNLP